LFDYPPGQSLIPKPVFTSDCVIPLFCVEL
jgi:hypothetical protein